MRMRHRSHLADRIAADQPQGLHPDVAAFLSLLGVAHTTGGRRLPVPVLAASWEDQQRRLADPAGWSSRVVFDPWKDGVAGARAFNRAYGLPDPMRLDYHQVMQTPDRIRDVGRHYDSLHDYDPAAEASYGAMARDVDKQFDHLTNRMGVDVEVVDFDPYPDVHAMVDDLRNNRRMQVLSTEATGGHPFFDNATNDKFRAVHDAFGHGAIGRSFDRHGEEAAYLAHAQMFTPEAQGALATETRGQNASLILNGEFGPQKMALMDPGHWQNPDFDQWMPKGDFSFASRGWV